MRSREGFLKKHWRHNSMFACQCERPAERKFHHVGKEGQNQWNNVLDLVRGHEAGKQSGGMGLGWIYRGSSEGGTGEMDADAGG